MCACRTDGKTRSFDVTPNGPGQLVGRGTEQRPPEGLGPSPGACLFPPPLSRSSLPSSDQYWLLITEDSMLALSFLYLSFYFKKPPFFHNCASYKVCMNLFTPLHVSHRAFLSRFATHCSNASTGLYKALEMCATR